MAVPPTHYYQPNSGGRIEYNDNNNNNDNIINTPTWVEIEPFMFFYVRFVQRNNITDTHVKGEEEKKN